MTHPTAQLVELLGVHSVPPGSVVVLRNVDIEPDEDLAAALVPVVGHDRFVVLCLYGADASMSVADADDAIAMIRGMTA